MDIIINSYLLICRKKYNKSHVIIISFKIETIFDHSAFMRELARIINGKSTLAKNLAIKSYVNEILGFFFSPPTFKTTTPTSRTQLKLQLMREQLQEQERRQAEFRQSLQQQRPAAALPRPVPPTPLPTIGVDVPPQVLQVCNYILANLRERRQAELLFAQIMKYNENHVTAYCVINCVIIHSLCANNYHVHNIMLYIKAEMH